MNSETKMNVANGFRAFLYDKVGRDFSRPPSISFVVKYMGNSHWWGKKNLKVKVRSP